LTRSTLGTISTAGLDPSKPGAFYAGRAMPWSRERKSIAMMTWAAGEIALLVLIVQVLLCKDGHGAFFETGFSKSTVDY
jgi:hypothetical protein